MESFILPGIEDQNERIVFVDDVQAVCQQYNILEDNSVKLSSFSMSDPDYTPGVVDLLSKQGLIFTVRVQVGAFGLFLVCFLALHL